MRRFVAAGVTLLVGCAHGPVAARTPASEGAVSTSSNSDPQAWRSVRPTVPDAKPIPAPHVQTLRLANGIPVYLVENHTLPLVAMHVVVRAGWSAGPRGAAQVVGLAVRRGSQTTSPSLTSERLADWGAETSLTMQPDYSVVELQTLAEHFADSARLVADAVQHPDLRDDAFAKARAAAASERHARVQVDSALALDVAERVIYDGQPYGKTPLGDAHAYERLTANDVRAFHRDYWTPANTALVVVGDADADKLRPLLETAFGAWRGHSRSPAPAAATPPATASPRGTVIVIDRAATTQPIVAAALPVASRRSPSWYAMVVANYVLGGAFASRLNHQLRQTKGYSYGTYSRLLGMSEAGLLYAAGAVRRDVVGEAVAAILAEIDGMRARPPTASELDTARRACQLRGALDLETNENIAAAIAGLVGVNASVDEMEARSKRLGDVSIDDVNAFSAARLASPAATVVIVGPAANIVEQLRRHGFTATVQPAGD